LHERDLNLNDTENHFAIALRHALRHLKHHFVYVLPMKREKNR